VAGSDPIVVPLASKRHRKALAVQKLNHAIPAVGLLFAAKEAMAEGAHGFGLFLGAFEFVSAAILIVLTIRELRSALPSARAASRQASASTAPAPAHAEHHGVDWVDIAAGFVLVAEILEHWHLTGRIRRPTVLTAITTFALGLFHGRLGAVKARRRVLRVADEGIFLPGRPFKARRLQAAWEGVQSIEVGPRWAIVTTRAGRSRKLDLTDLDHEAAVRAALAEARNRLRLSEEAGG
jgi:hypothetical protein